VATEDTATLRATANPTMDAVAMKRLLFYCGTRLGLTQHQVLYMMYGLMAFFVLTFINSTAARIWRRMELWCSGIAHMFFSTDARFNPKKQPDPDLVMQAMSNDLSCSHPTRRIIFIRHGESCWNEIFNRGVSPMILVRLVKALVGEVLCMFGDDSVFLDSPLSELGMQQADELRQFFSQDPPESMSAEAAYDHITIRGEGRGNSVPSIITSSNLRRAIGTAVIGLWPRLQRTKEKIYLLSSCQEGSHNVDCVCLAGPGQVPPLDNVYAKLEVKTLINNHSKMINASFNRGNKAIFGSGLDRMKEFVEFCMNPELEGKTIIVAGHSLWFKKFFQTFMPHNVEHVAKDCKLLNCGVVGFTMTATANPKKVGHTLYRVSPRSMVEIFGPKDDDKNPKGRAFDVRKSKKWKSE